MHQVASYKAPNKRRRGAEAEDETERNLAVGESRRGEILSQRAFFVYVLTDFMLAHVVPVMIPVYLTRVFLVTNLDKLTMGLTFPDDESPEPTAAPVAQHSNDNVELMGTTPDELFVGEGQQEMTTSLFQGPVVSRLEEFEVEDTDEDEGDGPPESLFGPNPCSNDNKDWSTDTLNCTNTTTLVGIFGDVIEEEEAILEQDLDAEEQAANSTATSSSHDVSAAVAPASELDQCAESDLAVVSFAYDIYTSPNVTDELGSMLSDFERRLSKGVARAMGVLDCSDTAIQVTRITTDQSRRRMLRRRSIDSRMLTSQDVLAIAALPLDSILDADCTPPFLDLDEPFACFPVDGAMSVTISATGKRYARNLQGILTAVKYYIEQGAYTNNDILHVKYLGTREDVDDSSAALQSIDSANEMNAETTMKFGNNGIGGAGYLVIALVLVGVFSIASLFVHRRRTRGNRKPREQDQINRVPAEGDFEADLEEVFVDLDSSIESKSQDDTPSPSSLAVMGGMATGIMRQMSAPSAPASSHEDAAECDNEAVSNNVEDAPEADEFGAKQATGGTDGTVTLGPSPPVSPSASRDEVPQSPPSSPSQRLIKADGMDNFDMTPVHLSSSSDEASTSRKDMFCEGSLPSLSKDDSESSFIGNVDPIAADAGFIGDVDDAAEKAIPTERTAVDDVQYV